MKFGYTIVYVPDVAASLGFFEKAFGFKRRFLHESGTYGELETGETTLSFAADELADANFSGGHISANEISAPRSKPWGQVVSYVRCPDGTLVELCTPVGG